MLHPSCMGTEMHDNSNWLAWQIRENSWLMWRRVN